MNKRQKKLQRKWQVKAFRGNVEKHQCPDCHKTELKKVRDMDGDLWVICNACGFDAMF